MAIECCRKCCLKCGLFRNSGYRVFRFVTQSRSQNIHPGKGARLPPAEQLPGRASVSVMHARLATIKDIAAYGLPAVDSPF